MKFLFLILVFITAFNLNAQIQTLPFLTNSVDQVPENYGGKEELKRFIDEHLIYPEQELKNKTEGTVSIKFICDSKGIIKQYQVVKGISPNLNNEAIRLFKLLLWHPAVKQSEAVSYEDYIDFTFSINKYKKALKRRGIINTNVYELPCDTSLFIHEKAEKMPIYLNGKDSLLKYIAAELEYPQEAKTKSIEGTVVLSFIVEPNGRISNINIERSLGGGCQEEAIRVMNTTLWIPAQVNKKNVRCKLNYSIVFKLNSGFKDNSQGNQRVGGY